MQFWAKNGAYDWICDFSEYDGKRDGINEVRYTYLETAFWNNYHGDSPLKNPSEDTTPIVWEEPKKALFNAFFVTYLILNYKPNDWSCSAQNISFAKSYIESTIPKLMAHPVCSNKGATPFSIAVKE